MAESPKLSIHLEEIDPALLICPSGRIDGNTTGILEEYIQQQMDTGAKTLIFDFHDVHYISSVGLRLLLVTARQMQATGGKTLFCTLSPNIAQVFEISGFNDILDVRNNRDDALNSL